MAITLRDVIEAYEEKLRDLQLELDESEEGRRRDSTEYQRAWDDRGRAMERIKRCRGRECRVLAGEYEDDYPYRRRQR